MTITRQHPVYSCPQLITLGMVKVKEVAADLGVLPEGDKRLIFTWVDAIIEHQSNSIVATEPETATIPTRADIYY